MKSSLKTACAAALACLLGNAVAAAAQKPADPGAQPGIRWTGAMGVRESIDQIQRRERATPAKALEMKIEPLEVDRHGLPQNPGAKPGARWAGTQVLEAQPQGLEQVSPFIPQTLGTSFTGATLSGINPTQAFPPDSMGAVGPTQYIVMVNNRIVSFNKTTGVADGVINATTDVFFNSVRNNSGTSDPRIRYDRLSGRWFLIIINVSTPNRILIAVSSQSTITASSNFTFFFIPIDTTSPPISSTCLADYPTLGVDVNALYIGTNNFCGARQTFNSTDGYVVNKNSILGAGPLVATVFRGLAPNNASSGPFTPQGVDNYDPTSNEGHFIGVDLISLGTLMLRRVFNPGATPSISGNIAIATPLTTSSPLSVPHLGSTGINLDALDDRLFAAHLRNGNLWTAHNIAVDNTGSASGTGTRDGARWYEIQGVIGAGTPTVVQSGTVFTASTTNDANELYYWIPSVMVSGQGHVALGASSAGKNAHANAAVTGRLAGDPLGTMQAPVNYTNSTTAYNPTDTNPHRWGDYSYTSLDPGDDMTMWTIQEFSDATNSYAVRIVKLIAPPPASPASMIPASVTNGQNSVAVTVNGNVVSGSGFFDPGVGFPNRIAAAASGGIVVNSITYANPTTISLTLKTIGVAPGNYNLTVTNPDGQSITANGLITVTSSTVATTTGLVSSANPSLLGNAVTFTASVTPSSATGSVTFMDGGTTLATVGLSSGSAAYTTSGLAVGSHNITAVYGGDAGDSGSSSPVLVQVVGVKKRRSQVTSHFMGK